MTGLALQLCPCGTGKRYAACCGPLHLRQEKASTAEALMRSRYSAYALGLADYLRATWHPSTCPARLELEDPSQIKWLALEVRRHEMPDDEHAFVEFVARYRIGGRGHRLHEVSRFVCEGGRWLYLDGDHRD